ncbi:DUF2087 domain-containing protein [Actinokineospora soli]|uniref:DUF2087 domain-containing protein n=1 Tax=Actinokineospora soli TaxID=1048753 RepID=A0ABW2TJQ5_9PSEU
MPAHAGKRRVVLEHVVQSFEPGVRYSEKEVDVVLRAWCEGGGVDFVTVRRYLVDAGLLSREAGEYWRSGGTSRTGRSCGSTTATGRQRRSPRSRRASPGSRCCRWRTRTGRPRGT